MLRFLSAPGDPRFHCPLAQSRMPSPRNATVSTSLYFTSQTPTATHNHGVAGPRQGRWVGEAEGRRGGGGEGGGEVEGREEARGASDGGGWWEVVFLLR